MKITLSVIIPAVNNAWLTGHCVQEVRRCATVPTETIIVDNGSEPDQSLLMEHYIQPSQYLRSDEMLGYPAAVNVGLASARGDFVLLVNNDAWPIDEGWDRELLSVFGIMPGVEIVSPVCNFVKEQAQYCAGPHELGYGLLEVQTLNFVAVVMRRSLPERIGPLDERFGLGNYEDDDYCRRVRQAGGALAVLRSCFVWHAGHQTMRSVPGGLARLIGRNRELYRQKWGSL